MSDISKDELKKEIAAVLKDADLGSITSKKVRQEIEKKLDIDLAARRKEVDELVMEYIDNDKGKSKKNGNVEDDDEEEEEEENEEEDEEEDEEDEEEKKPKRSAPKKAAPAKRKASSDESEEASDDQEGDDEYSPKKKAAKKGSAKRGGRKKKGGSDDDSDEDWGKGKKRGRAPAAKKAPGAKRTGGGYTKPVNLSPELAALVGEDQMPRHEVVKRVWALIKERNLYDPKNKQFAICDDELFKVIGVKRFRTFGMMKFLKNHFVD